MEPVRRFQNSGLLLFLLRLSLSPTELRASGLGGVPPTPRPENTNFPLWVGWGQARGLINSLLRALKMKRSLQVAAYYP